MTGVVPILGALLDHIEPPYRSPRATAFIRESLPYLLGSGGTLCFDVIIVTQGIIYGRRERLEEEEDEVSEEEDEEVGQGDFSGLDRQKDTRNAN